MSSGCFSTKYPASLAAASFRCPSGTPCISSDTQAGFSWPSLALRGRSLSAIASRIHAGEEANGALSPHGGRIHS